ncbi:probable replication factor C subunit 1 isoform X2 [Penaeus indicus]|uniref:probable replication factor C subunit 1 isoform X2 n=1 Tax=Penaeus indicus TaxID=29960 RepID=UPI00300D6C85
MATNIDELVKEAEETDFVIETQDELLTLIETLRDFEQEAEKRLKDIKTSHCDKNETKEAKNEEGDADESREPGISGGDSAAELTLEEVRRELMSLESEGHEDGNKQSRKDTGVSIDNNDKGKSQRPNVKFDMDAFNEELANLLVISGKAVEPQQAWRAIRRDTPKDVPTTPPSTPSHTDRPLPGQTQEPAPPASYPMAPPSQAPPRSTQPPPKPPRTFLATSDNLKMQPMPLSKSTSDLEQPGTSSSPHTPRGEALTASPMTGEDSDSDHRTKTNGKRENIFFPSLMGKKVKEKITTMGRKKPKRSKSLISDPMDFRVLYNGMLPNHRDNDREQQTSVNDPNDSSEEDPRKDKIKA